MDDSSSFGDRCRHSIRCLSVHRVVQRWQQPHRREAVITVGVGGVAVHPLGAIAQPLTRLRFTILVLSVTITFRRYQRQWRSLRLNNATEATNTYFVASSFRETGVFLYVYLNNPVE